MDMHRNAAGMVLSLLMIAGALSPDALLKVRAQDVATDLVLVCPAREEQIAIRERTRLLAAVPVGVAITALPQQPAQELPEGTNFVLSLDHLTLAAGTETKSRRTVGPTLFLVQDGTMAVIDSGRPRQPVGHPGFGPGESVLVERTHLVKLQNTGDEAGSILLLGLLPPKGKLPIGPFGAPANIWIPFPEEREQLIHRQMLSGEIGGLPREETLLFAACLHWTDPAAEITAPRYPGPVGLLVLRGQVLVNETERIGAGICWLSPSYASPRIRAGEQAPDIVLFGALKSNAQPETAAGGSDASASLDWAGLSPTDET